MTSNRQPFTDNVLGDWFRVIDAPEPLEGGADLQLDFVDDVIWLAPGLLPPRRERVIAAAVAEAWAQAIELDRRRAA